VGSRASRGRRVLGRIRRGRLRGDDADSRKALPAVGETSAGWDYTVRAPEDSAPPAPLADEPSLRAQVLSLLSDPRVPSISIASLRRQIARPQQDIETALAAMLQAGELLVEGQGEQRRFRVSLATKRDLEAMFREAALELGAVHELSPIRGNDALSVIEDDAEEPRLPVTAGLLSLFLPGTGQLLNGDVGRASLVFAVWSLAWITHLSPVWTFVCLYAGAEAFFTAKIRSMERKMAKDTALPSAGGATPLPPPKPTT